MKASLILCILLMTFLAGCFFQPTSAPPAVTPAPTSTGTPTPDDSQLAHYPSTAKFQVFILNPVTTCLAGNEFASGNVCYGDLCGDCSCAWEDFDPPAPLTGIPPAQINDPLYADYENRACLTISLTPQEVRDIKEDMQLVARKVAEWSEGTLTLEMEFTELPHVHTGFVAPDFVFGPFEVDDELLNPYVGVDTDFVYVVNGVYDRNQALNLSYMCGGSYGEMTVHGAGYANIQYNDICNSITIGGQTIYEPLIHEWYHNLDWALFNINRVPDHLEGLSPDWAKWQRANMPACGSLGNPVSWFPSIDLCEWDPDWMDCNNTASAGRCVHAGEVGGEMSWYEHIIGVHYPGAIRFIGNTCRDARQDFGETGVDSGGPCP